ncbi:4Fe-4S binding protein [Lutispora saccharofermentans]|uniref:4Fe-4S binding protein n=1 Tax=Lutispora saccharofermentans TaxID=3024236 RepID=A0ABT1NE52_9FIRM|nr:4Fe-4S binding protein [Lutispora saccharofermentans]MCQ1529329.1 4Fe-4S binding protein [Lutispora saccharofermentans]
MKKIRTRYGRGLVQASIFIALIIIVLLYDLYTDGKLSFKLLGIGDLNPYGGWSALHQFATDSSYTFEGISKSAALTAALLTIAVIGGRFFCGWLCPIGAMQDFSAWLGSKMKIPRFDTKVKKAFNPLFFKYPILLSILLISILGYGAIIAGLSPWRALLSLLRLPYNWAEMKTGFAILMAVFLASMFLSRFFCRYLCPLGAAQALFGSLSLFSLKHGSGCSRCGICLDGCPVGIRLSAGSDTISPECIRCMDCIDGCKSQGIQGIHHALGKKRISLKAYASLMLTLFIFIWLGVPHLFAGSLHGADIRLGSLRDGTYQGEARGFAGKILTEITITEGRIAEIKIIEHHESKGWYEEVFMMLPKEIIKKQSLQVDSISGATKTSKGLIRSVANAVNKA